MGVRVVCLGAGQDVGRSCVLVTVGGKNIMFDCGMHMGYNDERRFPDFTYISKTGNLTDILDAVIITHFHLDHCGALPFFTEMCGYDGPIYMTYPTKAICPIMLEDYRKISVERKGITNFFTSQMVKDCMKKVTAVNLHETIRVDDDLELKAYYAGHVLGAAMFYARAGGESVVYTGDYNMTPDRHLGSAWIDKCRPDVLITESTYATTIRDSKRTRERDFLKKVHDCVADGGKVLIPVFALGRAQELCILIESYWERMGLTVPVYFSTGLTERANQYYKLFINWTNQKIKSTFVQRNMFEFKCISAWERDFIDIPGPMVLFATPGMLHVGTSLDVFKKWAPDPKNMIIMPGYCVAGTVGAKVLAGQKVIEIDHFTKIQVNMQVRNLSFSAHADAKGIMELIRQCEPRHVVLVHGEKSKMGFLCNKIVREFGIDCLFPANGESITLDASRDVPVDIEVSLLKSWLANAPKSSVPSTLPHQGAKDDVMDQDEDDLDWDAPDDFIGDDFDDDFPPESEFGSASSSAPPLVTQQIRPHAEFPVDGILIIDPSTQSTGSLDLKISATVPRARIVSSAGATRDFGLPAHRMEFDVSRSFSAAAMRQKAASDKGDLAKKAASIEASAESLCAYALERIYRRLVGVVGNDVKIERTAEEIKARSVIVRASEPAREELRVKWDYKDEDFAIRVLDLVGGILAT